MDVVHDFNQAPKPLIRLEAPIPKIAFEVSIRAIHYDRIFQLLPLNIFEVGMDEFDNVMMPRHM